jgi:EAL domain-containing protein (putative c-di-GMP-specific phosphodiesterase class I)
MHEVIPDQALMASIRILYQPILRLADLRTDYVEVLSRAAKTDGTLRGPESIVDAMTGAERSMRLTASIMQRGLLEYEAFGFAGQDLCLAFNLPLDALLHPGLVPEIEALRAQTRLPARNIRFELTESHPVHDLAAAKTAITGLRKAGYGLALDDVTPRTPNLAALLKLPFRAIKLDRSVVAGAQGANTKFIHAMVTHASANQQDTIAEGIETSNLRDDMRNSGISHGQGFLFSHPLSAGQLKSFLSA